MNSARSKRRQYLMLGKAVAFLLVCLAPNVAADPAALVSQPADSTKATTTADARTGPPDNAPSQQQPIATPEAASPNIATDIEISHRFNDPRRELLDSLEKIVDWSLNATNIIVTLLGIIVTVAGYPSLKRLCKKRIRKIEAKARRNLESCRKYAEEARNLVDEIKARRDEAVPLLKGLTAEAVQEDPTASPISQAIADAVFLQQKGDIEKAIEKWHAVANVVDGIDKEKKTGSQAWFSIGYLLYRDELNDLELEKVIDAYDKALLLEPNDAEAYNNRGAAKDSLRRYKEALADYDKAISLKPKYANAYNNRGNTKDTLGRHEEALADYDEAIRLKPDLAEAYNHRGNTKDTLGRHEEALADYDEAIRLKPDLAEAYNNRGITNVLMERADEARRDFETAVSLARNAGDETLAKKAEHALKELFGEQDP